MVHVWLVNLGSIPLTSITLNYTIQEICSVYGTSQAYDTLALAPGDSIQLGFGPFSLNEYLWQPDTLKFCVLSARPNHRIDSDPIGNKVCAGVPFNITTSSSDRISEQSPALLPNPAMASVTLHPDLPYHGPFDVAFLDLQGRTALKRSMNYTGGSMRIGIEDLKPGVYIVEIAQAGHRSSHRLVIE